MIVWDERTLVVGQRDAGLHDNDGVRHEGQPYIVLRHATFEEWLEEYRAECAPDPVPAPPTYIAMVKLIGLFYEIATD